MPAGTGKRYAGGECWLRSLRAAIRWIGQSASWTRMGRLTSTNARLSRWRAASLASLRPLIQVSILKDRQHNSSRFHEDLPAFLRDARRAIRAPGVVLIASRSHAAARNIRRQRDHGSQSIANTSHWSAEDGRAH